jgi:site-specific recombinase XerD
MAGIDLNTVKEILGHSSVNMTMRYSHLSKDHKKKAVATLESVLKEYFNGKEKVLTQ